MLQMRSLHDLSFKKTIKINLLTTHEDTKKLLKFYEELIKSMLFKIVLETEKCAKKLLVITTSFKLLESF